jgi:hypothetical protein
MMQTRSGAVILAGQSFTADGIGNLVHVSVSDTSWRSFPGSTQAFGRLTVYEQWKAGAHLDADELWLFKSSAYRLERFNAHGEKTLVIDRQAPWFPSRIADSTVPTPATARPLPLLNGVTELPDGNIATVVTMPARDWRPTAAGANPTKPLYEHLVEVIDIRTQRLLTSGYVKQILVGVVSPGYFHSMAEGPDGTRFVDIWQVKVVRNQP